MQTLIHITDLHHSLKGTTLGETSRAFVGLAIPCLTKMKSQGELGANPILVFTGDLVQKGGGANDLEYDSFEKLVLKPITDALGIGFDRVIIVPGNHEIDIAATPFVDYLTEDNQLIPDRLNVDLRRKLAGFFHFVQRTGVQSVTRESPRRIGVKIDDTDFTILNGLAGVYSVKEEEHKDMGAAFFTPDELANMLTDLPKKSVVCMHHPLSWFTEKSKVGLTAALTKAKCRLLTGHEHTFGVKILSNEKHECVYVQGPASGTESMSVGLNVLHLSPSDFAVATRCIAYETGLTELLPAKIDETIILPKKSERFFRENTCAFYCPERTNKIAATLAIKDLENFKQHMVSDVNSFVTPPVARYDDQQARPVGVNPKILGFKDPISVLSGAGLSGKSTLCAWRSYSINTDNNHNFVSVVIDSRELGKTSIDDAISGHLRKAGAKPHEISLLRDNGMTVVFIDNFDSADSEFADKLKPYLANTKDRIIVSPTGDTQYTPAMQPVFLPESVGYYVIQEVTLPKAYELAINALGDAKHSTPNELVAKSFKSTNNLGTNRSMYFIGHLLRTFAESKNAAEPLDRYLLQKNIIDLELSRAHYEVRPTDLFDDAVYNQFLGQMSSWLYTNNASVFSEETFSLLVETYRSDMGMLDKQFPPAIILEVLLKSHVLRKIEGGYAFLVQGNEDYFLAKHMTHDESFKKYALTSSGMLALPGVVQLYLAQNSSDRATIEVVFNLIDQLATLLEKELNPMIEGPSREAIETSRAHVEAQDADNLTERLNWLREEKATEMITFETSNPFRSGMLPTRNMDPDEIAIVLLQIGCSIVGVSRTLKIEERKALFRRLIPLIRTTLLTAPLMANHLAAGRTVNYKGTIIRAEPIGALKKESDRFYIILRDMLHNVSGMVGTWTGSSSFYVAMKQLMAEEKDPLLRFSMMAQQIEAILQESTEHISDLATNIPTPILRDSILNRYVDALSLQPLNDDTQQNGTIKNLASEIVLLRPATTRLRGEKKVKLERRISDQANEIRKQLNVQSALGRSVNRLKDQ